MTDAPDLPDFEQCAPPTLLGDRLARTFKDLRAGSGAVTFALAMLFGLLLVVAALRPTAVEFTDASGTAFTADCGIETVLFGHPSPAVEAACGGGGGMRALALLAGGVMVAGGVGQLVVLALRRSEADNRRRGFLVWFRTALSRPGSRMAFIAVGASALVAAGAAASIAARFGPGALVGRCGSVVEGRVPAACGDSLGFRGLVLAGAGAVFLGGVGYLLSSRVRHTRSLGNGGAPRRMDRTSGAALAVAALSIVVLLASARAVSVEVETGDHTLHVACGFDVLVAGYPQPSVTAACRDAMTTRAAVGTAALAVFGGSAIVWAVAVSRSREEEGDGGPGPSGDSPSRGAWVGSLAVFSLAVVIAYVVSTPSASAESPVRQTWWTVNNLNLDPPLPPEVLDPTAVPPVTIPSQDVPDGGSEVAGTIDNPTGALTLRWEFRPESTLGTFVLTLAPDVTQTPGTELIACPLTGDGDFETHPGGGPISELPESDCDDAVPGELDADAGQFRFDVAALAQDDHLSVAILPVAGRAVFQRALSDSLDVEEPELGPIESPVRPTPAPRPPVNEASSPGPFLGQVPTPTEPPSVTEPPPPTDEVAAPEPVADSFETILRTTAPGDAAGGAVVGLLILAGAGGAVWRRGRHSLLRVEGTTS